MLQTAPTTLDGRLMATLDASGIVGSGLRRELVHELKSRLVLRGGDDMLAVTGGPGTGKGLVAEAMHRAAALELGRDGALVSFPCVEHGDTSTFHDTFDAALAEAQGGTLVLDRVDSLSPDRRSDIMGRLGRADSDALVVALETVPSSIRATRVRLKPLHEREDDIWELLDHFYQAAAAGQDMGPCRGFSRQAKADMAQIVRDTHMESVALLRDVVRDLVFDAAARGDLGLKLTSEAVRPYLEDRFGQDRADRIGRQLELVDSQFSDVAATTLISHLATLHGVSESVLAQQVQVLREVIDGIDDLPRSYRNIMDRSDDILRAALWLSSGAQTQAEFRRFFGDERFMRPTKSVAWAFYNRVFKRDM